ncbi:histidinol-phosphate transaminase [Methylomicrobium sp. Wu6]|uniref:histidinol-phosphate transaminase n=1 Tax=Methylomicrobium sp. Wu6 TaxID=3107928 RepID=UPI002DD6A3CB|nr:histidinol-phosphate transaminase [Methylomicrobium sp. Wu6]MEC4748212.1 histidinol-phosphate transaminase [Methylomicrobium sp. Wu6]
MTKMNDLIARVFRQEVLAMSAYHVADAEDLIKLDAMENPYEWPEDVKTHWLETLRACPLNRYPDPGARRLAATIKQMNGLDQDAALLLGNGSDEIIQLLLMALPQGSPVLSPEPGFVMYKQLSHCLGLNYIGIPLQEEDFALDLPAMLTAIERHQPKLIFLAYPNNPTGNLFNQDAIGAIIEQAPGLVVIDEAYEPFADASYLEMLGRHPNLLVMRTVSKLGLAGLRLGYLCGSPELIEQLDKIRLPYNINVLTQASAEFALNHKALFDQQTRLIRAERARVFAELNAIGGITAYPSSANFILFRTPSGRANAIFAALKQMGVLIKNLSPQGGILVDCLRVTIGKPDENEAFLSALKQSLISHP